MEAEKLTLEQIQDIAEHCCNTDCARYRAGTCPYIGRAKISCYLWQIARSEHEDPRKKEVIFVAVQGENVIGVFHSLQRAKRAYTAAELDYTCRIIQETVAYSPNGGIYHLQVRKWLYRCRWEEV